MSRHEALGAEFHRFWLAAAASNLGDGVRLAALPLLALSLTDDARLIGLVTASTLLPWLLFGPVGGAIVDRHDRRRLMIVGQVGRALLMAALVAAVAADAATIWWVVIVAFGVGAGEVVVDSSAQAAVPQLVPPEQFDRANSRLYAASQVLDQIVGVALGAVLFSVATSLPFVVDAATFAIGAVLLVTIRRPLQGERHAPSSLRADIAEGARFLFRHRLLRSMMLAAAITNIAMSASVGVFVVLVVDELGAPEASFGLVMAIGSVGGVIGSLTATRIIAQVGRKVVLVVPFFVLIATFLMYAAAFSPWVVSASFFIASFTIICTNVAGQSIRQAITPEALLGRVVATYRMVGMGAAPVGAIVGGFITQATDVRVANFAAAGIQTVAALVLLPALRHLDRSLSPSRATEPASAPASGDGRLDEPDQEQPVQR